MRRWPAPRHLAGALAKGWGDGCTAAPGSGQRMNATTAAVFWLARWGPNHHSTEPTHPLRRRLSFVTSIALEPGCAPGGQAGRRAYGMPTLCSKTQCVVRFLLCI